MSIVRWDDVDIRLFMDDDDYGSIHATDFSWDTQLNVESTKYQGDATPTIDASYNGERFSMTLEIAEGGQRVQNLLDEHVAAIRDRTGLGKVQLLVSHREPDQSIRAYRFRECILTPGRSARTESRNQVRVAGVSPNFSRVQ